MTMGAYQSTERRREVRRRKLMRNGNCDEASRAIIAYHKRGESAPPRWLGMARASCSNRNTRRILETNKQLRLQKFKTNRRL